MKRCLSCNQVFSSDEWRCPACSHVPDNLSGVLLFAPELANENDGFDENSFDRLFEVEENNFWFRARNALISWAIGKYFSKAETLMEVGCGTGFVLSGIHKAHPNLILTGTEIFVRGLDFAGKRLPSDTTRLQMDARHIPFVQEFDLIGAFDVLEHIEEDETVLGQMFMALKPGGGLLLSVPQHPWLWSEDDERACHKRRYRVDELQKKAEQAGFTVLRSTSFVSILLPVMALSRLFRRIRPQGQDYTTGDGLKLSGALNRVFGWLMGCERWMIKSGFDFPWGGSRLLIACKPQ